MPTETAGRRGVIKVNNTRKGTFIQEELNGSIRVFRQPEWQKELEKRSKMSEENWAQYAGLVDEEEEEVKGVESKKRASKKSTQKKVVDKPKSDTLIEDDVDDDDA